MKIGILGATGAVGRQMLECIKERNIPAEEIRLFASERSKGTVIEGLTVQVANEDTIQGLNVMLGAVSNALSKEYAPLLLKHHILYIDNSSAFRSDKDIPLVVPEINGEDALNHHGIIANPNCSTIITLMALAPVAKLTKITNIIATTFQAVSGAGIPGLKELREEEKALYEGTEYSPSVFPYPIAHNVIAEIGSYLDNGYTAEEMKMQNEGRKILHLPDLTVNCTCVRVPVERCHSISVTFETEQDISIPAIEEAIEKHPGVELLKEGIPTPLKTSNQDTVYVGRIRISPCHKNEKVLWCCGDQIRKGAASNAVQILEYVLAHQK